jgi:hypothetical protein
MNDTTKAPASIADAIDQGVALANSNGAPPPPPADDNEGGTPDDQTTTDSTTEGAGADDASGGGADGDQSGGAGEGTGTEGDGTPPADGEPGADGTEGDDAAGDDKAAGLAPGKDGKETGQPEPPDPLTAPIPNALKRETKERIHTLIDRTKTAEAALETATAERNELITAITETGASPEQYAGVLDYLTLVNSGDRNKLIQAANFMIRELSALSRVGGFRIPGVTSYSGHKDLEDAVAAGKIAPELAEELAAGRAAQAHQGKIGAAQQQASEAKRKYEAADLAARQEMNTMEAAFRKDPLYNEKRPIILELLNEMIRGDAKQGIPPLHPSKWPAAYKKIYNTLPKTLGGMKPTAPASKIPANQPLRTQQPAGAQKQEPKSVAEALEMGIEMARGG